LDLGTQLKPVIEKFWADEKRAPASAAKLQQP
jgi:hypothetical protein